ncbi:MAG: aldehyde dehydrogenase family protein, partial [Chloroflexota bacterium]|nr:aldehyde dehydrogenase family protein [Chloroflexota bacterium]
MAIKVKTYGNYIGGRWHAPSGGLFENIDPATGEVLGYYPLSTGKEARLAVSAARQAFDTWRKVPAPKRGEILFRAGELMLQRKEELARCLTMEMGKVLKEARGDVQEGIDMTYYMAAEGRRLFGEVTPSELPNKFALAQRVPVGVIVAITPWNFPFAIPTWKLMPALVAGNTVVFKPSRYTPESAYHLVRIMEEAGLPPGVLNLVYGEPGEVGTALVEDPGTTLVSFTGSSGAGRDIAQRAAHLGKRFHLEMGGKNAIIVLDDADLDLALQGIVWSAFGSSGQRCTAASRLIVQRGVLSEVTEKLVALAKQLRLGLGISPDADVGPVINREQLLKIEGYVRLGVEEGASLLAGGRVATEGELKRGFFFEPTVFGNVSPRMRIAQEEIFGPVTVIIPADSLE